MATSKEFAGMVAIVVVLALLIQSQPVTNANPILYPKRFPLNIYFDPSLNDTYYSNSIILNVTLEEVYDCNNTIRKAWYSLDGQDRVPISLTYLGDTSKNGNALLHSVVTGNIELAQLSLGSHNITVFGEYTFDTEVQTNNITGNFKVMTGPLLPTVVFTASLAPSANSTYFGGTINFTVTADWGEIPYRYLWFIDDQLVETTSSPYYTVHTLAVGDHHIQVRVIDSKNNSVMTSYVFFEVLPTPSNIPSPSPEVTPSPTIPEFHTSILMAFIVISTLAAATILRRKRKRN